MIKRKIICECGEILSDQDVRFKIDEGLAYEVVQEACELYGMAARVIALAGMYDVSVIEAVCAKLRRDGSGEEGKALVLMAELIEQEAGIEEEVALTVS